MFNFSYESALPAQKKAVLANSGRINLRPNFEVLSPYIFLAPSLFFLLMFSYFPFLKTIVMSLAITNNQGHIKKLVGLQNYVDLFTSKSFLDSLVVTLKFAPMIFIPTILFAMFLAILADKKIKGLSPIFEVMFSLPMAVASASAAIIWKMVFVPSVGALNYILGTNINWLTDRKWALFSVALVTVWLQVGINFIFLVTGLRGVPQELSEGAMIDGAGTIATFLFIKLPMISPTLFFVAFFNTIVSFQAFGQIRLLTQGGPGTSTTVLVYSTYLEAFMNKRYGSAGAMSIVLFLIMLCITLLQFCFEKKGVHYS